MKSKLYKREVVFIFSTFSQITEYITIYAEIVDKKLSLQFDVIEFWNNFGLLCSPLFVFVLTNNITQLWLWRFVAIVQYLTFLKKKIFWIDNSLLAKAFFAFRIQQSFVYARLQINKNRKILLISLNLKYRFARFLSFCLCRLLTIFFFVLSIYSMFHPCYIMADG